MVFDQVPRRSCRTTTLFLKLEISKMKRIAAAVFTLSLLSIGIIGCAEKSSTKTETTVTTPTGTKTVTHETEVKETGKPKPTSTP